MRCVLLSVVIYYIWFLIRVLVLHWEFLLSRILGVIQHAHINKMSLSSIQRFWLVNIMNKSSGFRKKVKSTVTDILFHIFDVQSPFEHDLFPVTAKYIMNRLNGSCQWFVPVRNPILQARRPIFFIVIFKTCTSGFVCNIETFQRNRSLFFSLRNPA